jgi:ketosteroid isomerase-like protein
MATAFVEGYGRTWGNWDFDGFVDLFKDDVVYVEHPVNETIVGREAMERYIRREQAEAGTVHVRMGKPIVDGDRVAAEFWTAMSNRDGEPAETLAGCWCLGAAFLPGASCRPGLRSEHK